MSEADQFRKYADEALRWAAKSTTAKERRNLLDLARTWSQAATVNDPPTVGVNYTSTDHRTAR